MYLYIQRKKMEHVLVIFCLHLINRLWDENKTIFKELQDLPENEKFLCFPLVSNNHVNVFCISVCAFQTSNSEA